MSRMLGSALAASLRAGRFEPRPRRLCRGSVRGEAVAGSDAHNASRGCFEEKGGREGTGGRTARPGAGPLVGVGKRSVAAAEDATGGGA